MGIILRLIREIYFKMKISALIFSAASAQYAETEAPTAAPVPETPAPAPVEVYNCFPANGDGATPCGCQWNTLETFENKTCTVTFGDSGANILQFQAHGGWTQGNYGGAQGSYIVQVIRSASDVAAGTFEFNDGVALGNATVGGVTPVTVTGGDVAAVFNVDSTANSQQIE